MNTFFYAIIFIIGTVFGSFYTLGVYRIPRKEDITHKHSYCPNCNHKLGFLDLIPVLSYIFLGAKCRYCKQKIRPRYFILEILSGTLFLAIAYFSGLIIYNITTPQIIEYSFMALYLTYIILICGIDKENRNMNKGVNIYGIVISIMYMLYLCIVGSTNIYRYGIYLLMYIIVLILDTITLKKFAKNSYATGMLLMVITMAIFTGEYITGNAVILTLLSIAITSLINKIIAKKNRKKAKDTTKEISIGFLLGFSNILWLIIVLVCNKLLI